MAFDYGECLDKLQKNRANLTLRDNLVYLVVRHSFDEEGQILDLRDVAIFSSISESAALHSVQRLISLGLLSAGEVLIIEAEL